MIYIKKGKHYPTPFQFPKFYWNLKYVKMWGSFRFSAGCNYHIEGENMHDINKLFGISFGWHHKYSERIGWRYKEDLNKIELLTYSYHLGKRIKSHHLAYINLGDTFNISLEIEKHSDELIIKYSFNAIEIIRFINKNKIPKLSYTLGVYFGGNEPAPNDIYIFGITQIKTR